MKTLITFLMIAALMAAPIGCGGGPGSSGENPGGDGMPISDGTTKASDSDADPETGKVHSNKDILDEMGPGGEADPLAPFEKGKKGGDGN